MTDAITIENCVCGYHYYQVVWEPIGKQLLCAQLRTWESNLYDQYAVAVLKEEIVSCWSYVKKIPNFLHFLWYTCVSLMQEKGTTLDN